MALYLNNKEQTNSAKEAIDALENGIRQLARGRRLGPFTHRLTTARRPRIDNLIPTRCKEEFFSFSSIGEAAAIRATTRRIKPCHSGAE